MCHMTPDCNNLSWNDLLWKHAQHPALCKQVGASEPMRWLAFPASLFTLWSGVPLLSGCFLIRPVLLSLWSAYLSSSLFVHLLIPPLSCSLSLSFLPPSLCSFMRCRSEWRSLGLVRQTSPSLRAVRGIALSTHQQIPLSSMTLLRPLPAGQILHALPPVKITPVRSSSTHHLYNSPFLFAFVQFCSFPSIFISSPVTPDWHPSALLIFLFYIVLFSFASSNICMR